MLYTIVSFDDIFYSDYNRIGIRESGFFSTDPYDYLDKI